MPGFELIGKEEEKNVLDIFKKSNGVMFAHGFEKLRNHIFRVRELEKKLKIKFKSKECQVVLWHCCNKNCLKAMGATRR